MSSDILRFEGIRQKYFGRQVLAIDELSIYEKEILCLLGPSGVGKSTFLRLADLVERPMAGQIHFMGEPVTYDRMLIEKRRKMAMVFQDPLLFDTSVINNIAYGLKARNIPKQEITARVHETAEMIGIKHLLDRNAREISGGEAHRVSLARALAVRPTLLLLDEPFASLDVLTRTRLEDEVKELIKGQGLTAIMVTHDQEEAMSFADRLAVLNEGTITQQGKPDEIYLHPNSGFVARFFGVENIFEGAVLSVEDGLIRVDIDGKTLEAVSDCPEGSMVQIFIRAEEISILLDEAQSGSARNRWKGQISSINKIGALAYIDVDCGREVTCLITRRSLEDMDLRIAGQVTIAFKATAVKVIPVSRVQDEEQ